MFQEQPRTNVILFDDGSVLFYSAAGGRWKDVPKGEGLTGTDTRVLTIQEPDAFQAIREHQERHAADDPAGKGSSEEEGDDGKPGSGGPRNPPTHRTRVKKAS